MLPREPSAEQTRVRWVWNSCECMFVKAAQAMALRRKAASGLNLTSSLAALKKLHKSSGSPCALVLLKSPVVLLQSRVPASKGLREPFTNLWSVSFSQSVWFQASGVLLVIRKRE